MTESLTTIAQGVARKNRRQLYVFGAVLVVIFIALQTVVILVAARLTSKESQRLADRVDRNLSYVACVHSYAPQLQTEAVLNDCLEKANERFGVNAPPPPSLEAMLRRNT